MTNLVFGATGLQGGAVTRELLSRGASVRGVTRDPEGEKAIALRRNGVDVVYGDYEKPESLPPLFDDVQSVYSVQDFYAEGVGFEGEIRHGRALIDAAQKAGGVHIVQSTMGDMNGLPAPDHFVSKATIERELIESGLSYTLLGTVGFMDNFLNPEMKPHLMFPILSGSLKSTTRYPMLAVADLAWVAAEAMLNPQDWKNRKINLAGDALTVGEMKEAYGRATGLKPRSWRFPGWLFRRIVPEFGAQLAWHNTTNFAFGPEELTAVRSDRTTFEGFVTQHELRNL